MTTTDNLHGSILRTDPAQLRSGWPVWAAGEAERLLAELPEMWRHTQEVAERARSVAGGVRPADRDLLIAAAYLHDIGHADPLVSSGFHALDGAVYLHRRGLQELSCLVAHHTGAHIEAKERGLTEQLAGFPRPTGPVADALTYSDVTTGPAGEHLEPAAAFEEITVRQCADGMAAESRARAQTEIHGMVARTLRRARRNRPSPDPVSVAVVGMGCVTLIQLRGELTRSTADRVAAALEAVVGRGPHAVVIDMAMVTGLDNAGVDILAAVPDPNATITVVDPRARDHAAMQRHALAARLPIAYGIESALTPHCGSSTDGLSFAQQAAAFLPQ